MSTSSDKSAVSSEILWDITWNFQERWKTNFYTQKKSGNAMRQPFFSKLTFFAEGKGGRFPPSKIRLKQVKCWKKCRK